MKGKHVIAGVIGAAVIVVVIVAVGWFTHPVFTVFSGLALLMLRGAVLRDQRGTSSALVTRWKKRVEKNQGFTTPWQVLRASSWWTVRRSAKSLLPNLRSVSLWARWRVPILEIGVRLVRVGWVWVMALIEEHGLILGIPRSGKSGVQANELASAPGAAIGTSTGDDLYLNTVAIRKRLGPVYIFNPSNVGGLSSTLGFNLLTGCTTVKVCRDRAHDLIGGTPLSETKKDPEWKELATSALASLMHAAALGERTMHHVQMWVADPVAAKAEVLHLLRSSPAMRMEAGQFLTNERHREGICMLIGPALRWLTDPVAVACTRTGDLDVEQFLTDRGTIYLIAEKDGNVAPLINAFAMHIIRSVRRIADRQPRQRLPQVFTAVVDEAPLICPMDLPSLTADSGKRNMRFIIGAQSVPQLIARWGAEGAKTITANCAYTWLFCAKDEDSLATFSRLMPEISPGQKAMTPDQFTQLPKLHAILFRNGILPVVGKPPMVWDRPDFRTDQRKAVWAPRLLTVRTAVRRARWSLTPRRRVLTAPGRPMLALPAGRADQLAMSERPGAVLAETRFDTEAQRLIDEALSRPGGNP